MSVAVIAMIGVIHELVGMKVGRQKQYEYMRVGMFCFVVRILGIILLPDGFDLFFGWGTLLSVYVYCAMNLRKIDAEKSRQIFGLEIGRPMKLDVLGGLVLAFFSLFDKEVAHIYWDYVVYTGVACIAVWVILGGLGGLIKRAKKKFLRKSRRPVSVGTM